MNGYLFGLGELILRGVNDVSLNDDTNIYKVENLNFDDLRHASKTNNILMLKFIGFH